MCSVIWRKFHTNQYAAVYRASKTIGDVPEQLLHTQGCTRRLAKILNYPFVTYLKIRICKNQSFLPQFLIFIGG